MIAAALYFVVSCQVPLNPIEASIAFFGCNRLDKDDWKGHEAENPSSANVPQLRQNLVDIASLRPLPKLVMAVGDLVLGYADDRGETLKAEIDAWAKLVAPFKTLSIVPVAGNHELNRKVGAKKLGNVVCDQVWVDWLARTGFSAEHNNGPNLETEENPDGLVDDQSRLTYSFDVGRHHFVVLNTDTRTSAMDLALGDAKVGWIPVSWVLRDLEKAQRNQQVDDVVLVGHRNLCEPASAHGDSPIDPDCAAKLIAALPKFSKVRAYVCAHVHAWDISKVPGTKVWQVVAGNGGSPPENDWKPIGGPTFGFGVMNFHRDGSIGIVGYHRPVTPDGKAGTDPHPSPAKPDRETLIYEPSQRFALTNR